MGRVTAIISAYYCSEWLPGRLTNLADQDERPVIIAVCQQDSAEHDILLDFLALYPVKIITTPDVPTIYAAWNMAIEQASTPYLTNANSDDRLYPGALRRLADALELNERYDVAYSNVDKVLSIDGRVIGTFDWATGGLATLLKGCFLGPMPMWRRSLHNDFGLFDADLESAGDYMFWLRLAYYGIEFLKVDGTCGAYLLRPDSAERRNPTLSNWESGKARSRYSLAKWWKDWENKYAGQTCFILGNGPSLNDVDLELLRDVITFGSNRVYLSGFIPDFHVTANDLVLKQFMGDILDLDSIIFRSGYEIDTTEPIPSFCYPLETMYEGYTVTFVCLEIAYYMGFSRVILVGVDHDYGDLRGAANEQQRMNGNDQGHFTPEYFKGSDWNLPDLRQSELSYQIARQWYEADGRQILNASTRTKLEVFDRVKLEDVLYEKV
jgi:glycosyltransferase involved in cell wall biosynthesis